MSKYDQDKAREIAEHASKKAELANKIETNWLAGNPLILRSVYVMSDSAGGQKPGLNFFNTSGKPFKYITFNVRFYNAVGDRPQCSITGDSTAQLKLIGPFQHGSMENARWNPSIYYNGRCSMEIESIEIEFMDGTSKRLDRAAVERCGSPEGWNTWEGIERARAADAARLGLTS